MKLLLIAALTILATAHAEVQTDATYNSQGLEFHLYTRESPRRRQSLVLGDVDSVTSSYFDGNRPTRIITHGFAGTARQGTVTVIRDAYLATGDYNVITVDWGSIAGPFSRPVDTVQTAGGIIAQFIEFLQEAGGLDPATTQLFGHSLGAHVVSNAARSFSGTIQAIVGLDTVGDVFENQPEAVAVGMRPGDADYVQSIITNAGGLGIKRAVGDGNFYLNDGTNQPGCFPDLFGMCSHFRAPYVFAETLTNPTGFPSQENGNVYMGGNDLSAKPKGSFTVLTRGRSPYTML